MQLHGQKAEAAEQRRRRQTNHDFLVSIALGVSVDEVVKRRDRSEIDWMSWLNAEMAEQKADTPQEIMPSICARLEERGALLGREAAKVAAREEVQRMLKKAIT